MLESFRGFYIEFVTKLKQFTNINYISSVGRVVCFKEPTQNYFLPSKRYGSLTLVYLDNFYYVCSTTFVKLLLNVIITPTNNKAVYIQSIITKYLLKIVIF